MSKLLLIVLLALSAIADTFIVQSNSSDIEFSVDKFFFVGVDGKFTKFKGKLTHFPDRDTIGENTHRVKVHSLACR